MPLRLARVPLASALLLLTASVAGAQVSILGQPGSYTTIQAAVDAAVDGDILIVEDGTYFAFKPFTIDGKGITLQARNDGNVVIKGLCSVKNVPLGKAAAVVGLRIDGPKVSSTANFPSALTLRSCAGRVRVQGCELFGGYIEDPFSDGLPAGHGLAVEDCQQVLVVQSLMNGGWPGFLGGGGPHPGGDALRAVNSGVYAYHCEFNGGQGSGVTQPGGIGGAGARVTGWGLFVSGSVFRGGPGGEGDWLNCSQGGDGGNGLVVIDSQVKVLDSAFAGGVAATYCSPGVQGVPISNSGGVIQQLLVAERDLSGPYLVYDNSTAQFTVQGQAGDTVWLMRSLRSSWMFLAGLNGLAVIPLPWRLPVAPAGVIGAGGTLQVPLVIPDLQGPQAGWTMEIQAVCVEPGGTVLSSPLQILVFNT